MFGYASEEAVGQSLALIVPPSLRGPLDRVIRGEETEVLGRRFEVHALHGDGSLFRVEIAITLTQEAPPIFTGFIRDLRGRRAAERALEESERRYREMVETTTEGIWMLNDAFVTTFVNRRLAEMLGYEPEEIVGCLTFDFMDDESRRETRERLERRRRGEGEHYRHQAAAQGRAHGLGLGVGQPAARPGRRLHGLARALHRRDRAGRG